MEGVYAAIAISYKTETK
ncbi:hypothetical protein PR048_019219 [Dryococelus australis]|uniref:Uncharacterized protein n=1 Tax=Dryococelus australis TaxID=614101 RepID=A0ABQ9H2W6_9NEOP|nr:hypothetical protein PR048_019219 [Dryococelus australis]